MEERVVTISVPVSGGVELNLDLNRARRLHRRLGRVLDSHEQEDTSRRPVVLVINGPIGSGKSTVAGRLAAQRSADGAIAVVCGLDEVVAMTQTPEHVHNDLSWDHAREAHAALVAAFVVSGVNSVIVEGGFFNRHERDFLEHSLDAIAELRWATLTVSYEGGVAARPR